MFRRRCIVPSIALTLALGLGGCGGDAAAPAHPATVPAPYGTPPPAYAQPQQPPAPGTKASEDLFPPRDLTSVDGALMALGADEQLLSLLLDAQGADLSQTRATCERVCGALGSMRRSVGAICELAGEDDARCDAARERLDGAERRVAAAGCTCPSS